MRVQTISKHQKENAMASLFNWRLISWVLVHWIVRLFWIIQMKKSINNTFCSIENNFQPLWIFCSFLYCTQYLLQWKKFVLCLFPVLICPGYMSKTFQATNFLSQGRVEESIETRQSNQYGSCIYQTMGSRQIVLQYFFSQLDWTKT